MQHKPWEFWIDVGGTFTDCFARSPDGTLLRHKLLSSGVTKGMAGDGSQGGRIVDASRKADPAGFWNGWSVSLLDQSGQVVGGSVVRELDTASSALLLQDAALGTKPGNRYELVPSLPAPVVAIRYLLGLAQSEAIPPVRVRLGTTRATNALITRSGVPTGLVTTRGFSDVLSIGYQNRPDLFALTVRKPAPLITMSVEIDERIDAVGSVLRAPHNDQIREQLLALKQQGIHAIAVCLLHSVANPAHELIVGQIAQQIGFNEISLSHQVAPLIKIVSRGDTTAVEAYLNPVMRTYLKALQDSLPGSEIKVLTSAGGLVDASSLLAKDAILSGPAGGVVGFSRIAHAAGFDRSIGFDMGGTSTDVARYAGRYEQEFETEKAGVRIVAPMLAIETVAAGGGSICRFDGAKLVVGPASAGADPGPAAYGRGGPLTVTDCNFLLGRLPADRFPFPLDRAAAQQRLSEIGHQIESTQGGCSPPEQHAEGFLQVANATMARAIRSVSTAKGYDVRDHALVSFGGAGGLHACSIARELGIKQILCHPDAGLLSAYGIGLADVVRHEVAGIYCRLDADAIAILAESFARLEREGVNQVLAEGIAADRINTRRSLQLRYEGTEAPLNISEPPDDDYVSAFRAEHIRRFGYEHKGRAIEIVTARLEVTGGVSEPLPVSKKLAGRPLSLRHHQSVFLDGKWRQVPLIRADELTPGTEFTGPAVVMYPTSTTLVEDGWAASVSSQGELLLTFPQLASADAPVADDLAGVEIFNHLFAGIAEQMGHTLRATATSVNVKERLDYSCALFDADGRLVASAAHIPVHLGAMGLTVRAVLEESSSIAPGDVFITNDPYRGGSHLPDITVVTPVHNDSGELLFFTASRAHHAEIGGITPGSMPPNSRTLAEEGVLISLRTLIEAGKPRFDELRDLLANSKYPSRDVATNLADISAQVAANVLGSRELLTLVERYSAEVVNGRMKSIRVAASQKVRIALSKIQEEIYRRTEYLDDGSPIAVTITLAGGTATIDFTGTAPTHPGNLNANRAITTAAVLYVLRGLVGEEIPLNDGMLEPISIVLPDCMLNPTPGSSPETSAAVAAGNVETSQRIVDALLGALGLAAASQGTMNNLLFGDETFGYYETICGGSGATADGPGVDAVHTHMTNTRLTDPEVLERRYPVRLHAFSIRQDSGGRGAHAGGNGVRREIEFLKAVDISIVSQRRGSNEPYGLAGGQPGKPGRNTLVRADGAVIDLGAVASLKALPGDRVIIETPGGGGWGAVR